MRPQTVSLPEVVLVLMEIWESRRRLRLARMILLRTR
eukprot:CAMPEP_0196655466 /NCGR_PEP_ID=MMETSP1086-20130531/5223_1 /TAXON_ID=77921 /ORGANISM="Cyanoptyche  gloeocystis , Strain SAG4.97" /LENGTH=36 /DNA_ID= /DNA_START= /DNA_END= /DNA_ORIENTATION=